MMTKERKAAQEAREFRYQQWRSFKKAISDRSWWHHAPGSFKEILYREGANGSITYEQAVELFESIPVEWIMAHYGTDLNLTKACADYANVHKLKSDSLIETIEG